MDMYVKEQKDKPRATSKKYMLEITSFRQNDRDSETIHGSQFSPIHALII